MQLTHQSSTKRKIFGASFQSLLNQVKPNESLFVFQRTNHSGTWEEITSASDYHKLVTEVDGCLLGGLWAMPKKLESFFRPSLQNPAPMVNPATEVFTQQGKGWSIISRPTESYVLSCIMKNIPVLDYFK